MDAKTAKKLLLRDIHLCFTHLQDIEEDSNVGMSESDFDFIFDELEILEDYISEIVLADVENGKPKISSADKKILKNKITSNNSNNFTSTSCGSHTSPSCGSSSSWGSFSCSRSGSGRGC